MPTTYQSIDKKKKVISFLIGILMNEICPSHLLLGIFKDLLRVLCFMREYWSSAGSSVAITCGDLIYFWTLFKRMFRDDARDEAWGGGGRASVKV